MVIAGNNTNVHQLIDGEYTETVQLMGIYLNPPFYQVPKWKWFLLYWRMKNPKV